MADWIKMRGNLWDDPRVSAICDVADSTEAAVIGALYWLWASADQHTEDGELPGLSLRQIDRKTGLPGFGEAMVQVGWLEPTEGGVRIVRFEEHNGSSAKRRGLDAQRKASVRKMSASDADKVRTNLGGIAEPEREESEKKQEQKLSPSLRSGEARKRAATQSLPPDGVDSQIWQDWLALRRAKRAPVTETVLRSARAEAGKAGMSLDQFLSIWCARGSQSLQAEWLKPHERAGPAPLVQQLSKTRNAIQKLQAMKIDERRDVDPQRDYGWPEQAALPRA
ncbi:hypothetical protein MNO14_04985 [Luteimonas sp. S4-F44]|uniref:hypothetical protein n=1 Tax=Luteimonas sp. S4-F44 TaxID=2925842 RepID=UPI001F52FFAF|nr:hypothetical protein [Luteimonas sp. S4-F44]UNK43441.1 hypothetical protein MNO14_04985 [Luteimonas sp. S4-F44]